MRSKLSHWVLAGCVVASLAAFAVPADADDGAKKERPKIYDEQADAAKDVDAAVQRAKRDHKRVLVQWGANWCGWCHKLHEVCSTNPDLKKKLLYEYEVVLVDMGNFDKHKDLAAKLGAELQGLPYLTVLDEDGKPIAQQETGALEVGEAHDPAKVLAFLEKHAAKPVDAETVLADALATAKAQNKLVFVHFGAPWCGWCHKLDGWLATADVATRMSTRAIEVKIDTERMTHGADVMKRFRTEEKGGIPWFAFLDADGKAVATSDGPDGNLGFPASDAEIEFFGKVLTLAHFATADVDALLTSLRAARDAKK